MYHIIYIYIYHCIKNIMNPNCLSIDNPLLRSKKNSQGVISNI